MIKQERHARICEYLDKHQFASINTLMEQIDASKSTVRRDLMELQEEKKIIFFWKQSVKMMYLLYREKRVHFC